MWSSDYRHIADTEFDGELINVVTQMHMQISIQGESIPYSCLMPQYSQKEQIILRVHAQGGRTLRGGVPGNFWKAPSQSPF